MAHSRLFDDFYIAGFKFYDGPVVLKKLSPGKKLKLCLDEENMNDENAVEIHYKKTMIGYIPRDRNHVIAQLLRFGHDDVFECRILSVDKNADPWKQVRVGVYVTDKS